MNEYISLMLIGFAAFLIPLLTARLNVPTVVGEILFGILLGLAGAIWALAFGSNPFVVGPSLDFLALLGFVFLMFMAGLEIDITNLSNTGVRVMGSAIAIFVGTLALSVGASMVIARFFLEDYESPFYLALMLSTTSVGVVLPTLRETGLSRRGLGQSILMAAMIADVGTMVLIAVFAAGLGTGEFALDAFVYQGASLLAVFVGIFIVYKLGAEAIWYFPTVLRKFFRSDDPHELGMRFSLAVVFIFLALAKLGNEALAVLGAFLAGITISALFREGATLTNKLGGIAFGFLVPLFFIKVGLGMDFQAMMTAKVLMLIPVLVLAGVAVKMVPALFDNLYWGGSVRKRLSKGVLLGARLSLIIAASEIGKELGVVSPGTQGAILALAIISCISVPVLFKRILGVSDA